MRKPKEPKKPSKFSQKYIHVGYFPYNGLTLQGVLNRTKKKNADAGLSDVRIQNGTIFVKESKPNPKYKQSLKTYNEKMITYKESMQQYKEYIDRELKSLNAK